MLQPVFTTSFQKDVKRIEKRGYDMEKLKEVIKLILLIKDRFRQNTKTILSGGNGSRNGSCTLNRTGC